MGWLQEIRAWPQRRKMNFIWMITGSAIIIMIILWIVIGNYHVAGSGDASSNIGSIVGNIKNDTNGKGLGK